MIIIIVMMRRSRRKVSGVDQETGVKVRHIWQEAVGGIREGIAPWPRPRDHQLEPPSTSNSQVCRSLVEPPYVLTGFTLLCVYNKAQTVFRYNCIYAEC